MDCGSPGGRFARNGLFRQRVGPPWRRLRRGAGGPLFGAAPAPAHEPDDLCVRSGMDPGRKPALYGIRAHALFHSQFARRGFAMGASGARGSRRSDPGRSAVGLCPHRRGRGGGNRSVQEALHARSGANPGQPESRLGYAGGRRAGVFRPPGRRQVVFDGL